MSNRSIESLKEFSREERPVIYGLRTRSRTTGSSTRVEGACPRVGRSVPVALRRSTPDRGSPRLGRPRPAYRVLRSDARSGSPDLGFSFPRRRVGSGAAPTNLRSRIPGLGISNKPPPVQPIANTLRGSKTDPSLLAKSRMLPQVSEVYADSKSEEGANGIHVRKHRHPEAYHVRRMRCNLHLERKPQRRF